MHKILEVKPIIIAALIGGLLLYFWNSFADESNPLAAFFIGATIGAGVQVGVRATGVS